MSRSMTSRARRRRAHPLHRHPLQRRAASARSSITAIPWACPTPRRCRRRIPWAWITSRSMPTKAAAPFRAPSRSAPSASRCSACAPRPRPYAASRIPCARSAPWRPTNAASASSIRNSRAGSRSCVVNTTGQTVRRGEALLEVYSPDLVLAQREYLVARTAAADMAQADAMTRDNAKAIAAAALSRLKNWDISADQLARLQRTGTATRTLTLSAPIGGIVMEKTALRRAAFRRRRHALSHRRSLDRVAAGGCVRAGPRANPAGTERENHRAGLSRPRLRQGGSPSSTRR